ncbi:hypothetical protein ACFQV2_19740 [Actinokineospora soli]|uniref:Sigma 54 modulation protein / S30EA ribosomal protein n=1 Tax=Actinokineospora soli TaxID=1048753 RepID=A0ABW2TNN4_9PSEU
MTDTAPVPAPEVVVRGVPGLGIGDHAAAKVAAALRHAHGPVHGVRIAVTRLPDPAVPEPVWVSCHVDLVGRTVHVHAYAATARTAVDRVVHRLVRRLESLRRDEREHPAPVTTAVGAVESHRSYGTPRCSLAEAVADLAALDEDAHLFTHESGVDFLLQRTPSGHAVTAPPRAWSPRRGWRSRCARRG